MHNPPHPGEILKELYFEPLSLSITETAKALDVTRKNPFCYFEWSFGH